MPARTRKPIATQRAASATLTRAQPIPVYDPQLATLVDEPPQGEGWLHELKYDGYRIGARRDGGEVELISRRGKDWTAEFPEIAEAVLKLRTKAALLDGEVAVLLPDGRTSFQALQNGFSGAARVLVYFVFDLLHLDGRDLRSLPLEERKTLLAELLSKQKAKTRIRFSSHVTDDGAKVLAQACELGAEGIISKR